MKRKTAKQQTTEDQSATREHRILEEINRRAYELWEAGGCQHGCDTSHWLQAEQEIRKTAGGS